MIAVLSATEHDYYAMPLPMAVYSWNRLNVYCVVFVPEGDNPKIELAKKYCKHASFYEFSAAEDRIPTFSQVSRLFGAAIPNMLDNESLITSDSDMCVFSNFFSELNDDKIHIVGNDLTPDEQYPMCYACMPVSKWKSVYGITKSYQEHIADIVNPIQSDNVRGSNWCLDQFLLKRELDKSGEQIVFHPRSNGQNQFAQKRADRDGWHFDPYDIIDAHLPRPLTDDENLQKVITLFETKYAFENFDWMRIYANEYKKLI